MSFEWSPLNTEPRAVATGSYTQLTIDRGSIGVEWPHPVATARGSVLSGDVACTYRSDFLHGLSFDTGTEVLGNFRPSAWRTGLASAPRSLIAAFVQRTLSRCARSCAALFVLIAAVSVCFSQATPTVSKVEPPSWWRGSSLNPVRLMIRGSDLKGARVQAVGRSLRVVGLQKVNDRGSYLFVDVVIEPNARAGKRTLRITTPHGVTHVPFEILESLNRTGTFQGFSPDDVMYLIMMREEVLRRTADEINRNLDAERVFPYALDIRGLLQIASVGHGFAARCEAVAVPRRPAVDTAWAAPLVRALPSRKL